MCKSLNASSTKTTNGNFQQEHNCITGYYFEKQLFRFLQLLLQSPFPLDSGEKRKIFLRLNHLQKYCNVFLWQLSILQQYQVQQDRSVCTKCCNCSNLKQIISPFLTKYKVLASSVTNAFFSKILCQIMSLLCKVSQADVHKTTCFLEMQEDIVIIICICLYITYLYKLCYISKLVGVHETTCFGDATGCCDHRSFTVRACFHYFIFVITFFRVQQDVELYTVKICFTSLIILFYYHLKCISSLR